MHVRLAFSVAAHFEPEIMLVDEVLSVGDAEFQARCLGRMEDINTTGRTVVFVSHQLQSVAQLCDRVLLMDGGQIVMDGPSEEVVAHYLQQATGTSSSQSWTDDEAPGDHLVRMRSVRVVRESGETADYIDVREPVGIELAFRVLEDGPPIIPKIKVVAGAQIAFNAMDVDARWREPSPPGEYVTTAWIPGELPERGARQGARGRLLDRLAEAPSPRERPRGRVLPRPGPARRRLVARALHGPVARRRPAAPALDDGALSETQRDRVREAAAFRDFRAIGKPR